jgi:hypothetical protein
MTHHSTLKRLNLAVAMTLALGLGITRALPVQAASLTNSSNNPLIPESQAFKLEQMTFNSNGAKTKTINTSYQGQGNSTLAPNTETTNKTLARSTGGQGESGVAPASPLEGIFFIAALAAFLIALFSNGGQGSKTQAAPPPNGNPDPGQPVPVPTPALLPGLLGLGLKLLQQKKADSERSLDAEVA